MENTIDSVMGTQAFHSENGKSTIVRMIRNGSNLLYSEFNEHKEDVQIYVMTIVDGHINENIKSFYSNGLDAKSKACKFYEDQKTAFMKKPSSLACNSC